MEWDKLFKWQEKLFYLTNAYELLLKEDPPDNWEEIQKRVHKWKELYYRNSIYTAHNWKPKNI